MTPRLCMADRRLVAEIMLIRREVSAGERARLPTIRDIAYRFNASPSLVYRVAASYPYVRVHPRDRIKLVPRETSNNPEIRP